MPNPHPKPEESGQKGDYKILWRREALEWVCTAVCVPDPIFVLTCGKKMKIGQRGESGNRQEQRIN
jgi:hypothetical protein